jgi:outer membrane murein-binding lipoprotein Lpp
MIHAAQRETLRDTELLRIEHEALKHNSHPTCVRTLLEHIQYLRNNVEQLKDDVERAAMEDVR